MSLTWTWAFAATLECIYIYKCLFVHCMYVKILHMSNSVYWVFVKDLRRHCNELHKPDGKDINSYGGREREQLRRMGLAKICRSGILAFEAVFILCIYHRQTLHFIESVRTIRCLNASDKFTEVHTTKNVFGFQVSPLETCEGKLVWKVTNHWPFREQVRPGKVSSLGWFCRICTALPPWNLAPTKLNTGAPRLN